jgi:hypothetical protein
MPADGRLRLLRRFSLQSGDFLMIGFVLGLLLMLLLVTVFKIELDYGTYEDGDSFVEINWRNRFKKK